MVFNATFNNISIISWQSVLMVEETGASGENQHYHIMSYGVPLAGFKLTLLVIGTDCIGSCKSYYHIIMTALHS